MSDVLPPVARLLQELIRIPSPNPPGDCARIATFCEQFLQGVGFQTRRVAPDDQAWSVVAWAGDESGPSILYHAHIDTVPLGQNARWTYDPFAGTHHDGNVYGLGSIDDKAPMAAMLQVAADLQPHLAALRGKLVVVCAADEETGGRRGTKWLVENGHIDAVDFVVVGEQTHNRIATANKGVVRAAFHVAGRTAHATEPWRGANAINGMARLIGDLERYQTDVLDARPHPLLGRPSVNVGVIEGGVSANVVPDGCTIRIDRRTVPGEDPQDVIAELQAIAAARQQREPDLTVMVDSFQISNWFQASANNPFAERILAISAQETSTPVEPIGYLPGSDAKHLVAVARQGMVVFGPGTYEVAHSTDEYTSVTELETTHRILLRFASDCLLP